MKTFYAYFLFWSPLWIGSIVMGFIYGWPIGLKSLASIPIAWIALEMCLSGMNRLGKIEECEERKKERDGWKS